VLIDVGTWYRLRFYRDAIDEDYQCILLESYSEPSDEWSVVSSFCTEMNPLERSQCTIVELAFANDNSQPTLGDMAIAGYLNCLASTCNFEPPN
jgi:hypothetical protein